MNSAYWSATTFGNDQFAQASLPNSSASQFGPGIAVRLSSSKGYFLWYGNSPNTVSLWRMDSATSWTQLKASGALTVNPSSDVWKIQAVGLDDLGVPERQSGRAGHGYQDHVR